MTSVSSLTDRPSYTRGIVLMIIAVMLFVLMDSTTKYLGQSYPVLQIVWARNTFHLLAFVIFLRFRWKGRIRTARPVLQLVRSSLLVLATFLFTQALRTVPLADASAVLFLAPILVTAFSVPILGERVGIRRWICVLVGFGGAMVVVRPGLGVMQVGALFALGTAVTYCFYMITTRILSRTDNALTTIVLSSVVGAVGCSIAVPFYWQPPDTLAWFLMVGLGVVGAISHYLLVLAFEAAPAAVVSPLDYTRLIWAAAVGYFLFGDFPDIWTILGACIIAASGLYILHRERSGAPIAK